MKSTNNKALKEWAAVVKALGEGRQTTLIRKQNLSSTHNEFFLYPTYTAQTKDRFKEQYYADFDASTTAKREGELTIRYYAQINEVFEVTSSKVLMDLDTHYVWTSSHVKNFFENSRSNKLYVLVLQVYKLPKPEVVELSWADTWYKGMTWVNLPEAISVEGLLPILGDNEFKEKVQQIKHIVQGQRIRKTPEPTIRKESLKEPDHNAIRDMVYKIGLYEDRPSEREYSIGNLGKLDIVWKRIHQGNPTHAFEVQIAGDFYKALAKLKHAFDLWDSRPVLVTTTEYEEKARDLMNGSFHEMRRRAIILNWKKIERIYKVEKELNEVREEIGL